MITQIKTIPHSEHRYETVGDYWADENGVLQVRISDMGNEDYAFLVAIHELIEEYLTRRRGLPEPEIKAFDEKFEVERALGKHWEEAEPGYDSRAPYQKEHTIASGIETMLAGHMGIDINDYARAITELGNPPQRYTGPGVEQPDIP
jgi:hypothetical protein